MFIREFKLRSNNQIKTSEKKGIIKEVLSQFKSVSEDELKEIIKAKESDINLCKIETHDSSFVTVYLIDKIPYFFKIDKQVQFIPTVYFLWRFPNALPKIYTHKHVFGKLLNGADLMLPGVVTPEPVNAYTFKHIQKDQLCAICLDDNDAPIAVGRAHLSGEDMYMSGMRGKCLLNLHIYKDHLWAMGEKSLAVPNIQIQIKKFDMKDAYQENFPSLGEAPKMTETVAAMNELPIQSTITSIENLEINDQFNVDLKIDKDEVVEEIDHEKILLECFQCAIRFKSKEFKLPIIVSTFMKIMQTCCPPGIQYDLKKTRFKKISAFLKEMESKGCIKLKDQKGVLSLTSFNKDHQMFTYYRKPEWMKEGAEESKEVKIEDLKFSFEIFEVYKIDGNTETLFRPRFKKGDIISSSEIRQLVTNYIKEKDLQIKENPRYFLPNETLTKLFLKKANADNKLTFEELFTIIFQKLTPMHQIKRVFKDKKIDDSNSMLRKGKFHPVEFKLESRGGNKKVTTVHNLATFEIDFQQLQQKLRKIIGCAVTLDEVKTPSAGASMIQAHEYIIGVQGNQICQIADIFKDELGIQYKHMKGLELGVKKP